LKLLLLVSARCTPYLSLLLLFLLPLTVVEAELYGRLDASMQIDNQRANPSFVQYGLADIHFDDKQQGLRTGTTLLIRQRDEDNEQQLQQLYIEKSSGNTSLLVGRTERADGLGLYTLDGGNFKIRRDDALIELYGGKPSRIEGISSTPAKWLYGGRILLNHKPNWVLVNQLESRFSLTRYQDQADDSATRFGFGLRSDGETGAPHHDRLHLLLQGNYLINERRLEGLHARVITLLDKQSDISFSYQRQRPDEQQPTLSGRFYNSYSRGEQSVTRLSYNQRQLNGINWSLTGRNVFHAYGSSGAGANGALRWIETKGLYWQAEVDWIALGDEQIGTLYLRRTAQITPLQKLALSGVIQQQLQQYGDDNQATGIEAKWEQRLDSELRFSLSTLYLYNSDKRNEFRLAARVSYRFDDRKRRVWQ